MGTTATATSTAKATIVFTAPTALLHPHGGGAGLDAAGWPAGTASAAACRGRARRACAVGCSRHARDWLLHLVIACPLDAIRSAGRVPIGLPPK